jgi:hypothetical protein
MANGTLAASQIEMLSQSGTGIVTITPPATNTDRTLSLPDAAGEMYTQGNILGTVSQSGGVPTGAIIESGSNANGEFVKYADGTMICTNPSIGTVATDQAATGSIFYGQISWTFPVAFAQQVRATSIASGNVRWGGNSNLVTTTATLTIFSGATSSATTAVGGIAIGRWF